MVYSNISIIWNSLILGSVSHVVTTDVITINSGIYNVFWGAYTLHFAASISIFSLCEPEYTYLFGNLDRCEVLWWVPWYNISSNCPLEVPTDIICLLEIIARLEGSTGLYDGVAILWIFYYIHLRAPLSRHFFVTSLAPCRHHFYLLIPLTMRLAPLLFLPLLPDVIPSVWHWLQLSGQGIMSMSAVISHVDTGKGLPSRV